MPASATRAQHRRVNLPNHHSLTRRTLRKPSADTDSCIPSPISSPEGRTNRRDGHVFSSAFVSGACSRQSIVNIAEPQADPRSSLSLSLLLMASGHRRASLFSKMTSQRALARVPTFLPVAPTRRPTWAILCRSSTSRPSIASGISVLRSFVSKGSSHYSSMSLYCKSPILGVRYFQPDHIAGSVSSLRSLPFIVGTVESLPRQGQL